MIMASDIPRLTQIEKLTMMELLWSDLAAASEEPKSPAWHGEELAYTARRFETGEEVPLGWSEAKNQLRSERK